MKKPDRKQLFSVLFFFLIFAGTVWYVFHDENISQIWYLLGTAKLCYVLPAILFVICFILGESVVIFYLMRSLGTRAQFFHCCLYSFIGFFYSAITPSASGGQPMQLIAMRRDGISGAASTVVLAIVTITYKLVLVLLGVGVLVFRPESIVSYLDDVEPLMYLGLTLNTVFIAFLLIAVFHPHLARVVGWGCFSLVSRIRSFRDPERVRNRLDAMIGNYSSAASFFRAHPVIIFNVFVITLVQRLLLFSVVWFTYLAFGLRGESAPVMILLYAMIAVAVDMLPLPGGMGISETLFLEIFEPAFGEALVVPGLMLCRGISYYTQLLISAVMTGLSRFFLGRRKRK